MDYSLYMRNMLLGNAKPLGKIANYKNETGLSLSILFNICISPDWYTKNSRDLYWTESRVMEVPILLQHFCQDSTGHKLLAIIKKAALRSFVRTYLRIENISGANLLRYLSFELASEHFCRYRQQGVGSGKKWHLNNAIMCDQMPQENQTMLD